MLAIFERVTGKDRAIARHLLARVKDELPDIVAERNGGPETVTVAEGQPAGGVPIIVERLFEKLASKAGLSLEPKLFVEIPAQRREKADAMTFNSNGPERGLDG